MNIVYLRRWTAFLAMAVVLCASDDARAQCMGRLTIDRAHVTLSGAGALDAQGRSGALHVFEEAAVRCAEHAMFASPRFVVTVTIATDGSVHDVRRTVDATHAADFGRCVERSFARLHVPTPPSGGSVQLTMPCHVETICADEGHRGLRGSEPSRPGVARSACAHCSRSRTRVPIHTRSRSASLVLVEWH
jgi:hypothetical protein